MKRLFQEVDIHILYIEILLLMGAAVMPHRVWVLVILAVIPQGRILTRAFIDYPAFKRSAGGYVITNEAIVVVAVALCLALWRVVF
jgi:hypothetical protein